MVNDTDFIFFENPVPYVPPIVYVDIFKSPILWGLFGIVGIWTLFICIGWRKDVKDFR